MKRPPDEELRKWNSILKAFTAKENEEPSEAPGSLLQTKRGIPNTWGRSNPKAFSPKTHAEINRQPSPPSCIFV